jgi:hypothetical protein
MRPMCRRWRASGRRPAPSRRRASGSSPRARGHGLALQVAGIPPALGGVDAGGGHHMGYRPRPRRSGQRISHRAHTRVSGLSGSCCGAEQRCWWRRPEPASRRWSATSGQRRGALAMREQTCPTICTILNAAGVANTYPSLVRLTSPALRRGRKTAPGSKWSSSRRGPARSEASGSCLGPSTGRWPRVPGHPTSRLQAWRLPACLRSRPYTLRLAMPCASCALSAACRRSRSA